MIIEDAAESLGATYKGVQTGTFGTYNAISFNGNKIITGSSGGMLLTDDEEAANKVRKWSTQARENTRSSVHEELGYNYRMSNVIAGVVRGQFPHLEEHITQKKAIYFRYKEAFEKLRLPVKMNPYDEKHSEPNFWLSCMIIDPEGMCRQVRGEQEALYISEPGKSCRRRSSKTGRVQRGGTAHLETDAHAADLPDERFRDPGRKRPGEDQCLHQRRR